MFPLKHPILLYFAQKVIELSKKKDYTMDMSKMLRDLQKMQSKMMKAQSDLKAQSFEAEAGGGMVKVAMNGKGVVTMIKINPAAVDKDDVEALEDLIMAAVNAAVKKKDDAQQASISDITGGMKIPGLM